jgi:hypothetical protein
MADVFISYKREERDAVRLIAEELRALKLDVWFDEAIENGVAYDERIAREIEAAKAVLTCWTPAASASVWVRSEAAMAQDKLVACLLRPTSLVPPFNLIQTEDLTSWAGQDDDPAWLKILARIGELADRPGLPAYHAVMLPGVSVARLRAWAHTYADDPLAETVRARIQQLEDESTPQRVLREEAETHERDRRREADAKRSRELARARRQRDAAKRPVPTLLWGSIVLVFVIIIVLVDFQRRQNALEKVSTPAEARAFLSVNRWHPIARSARSKFEALDQESWRKAQAQGTLAAYGDYLKQASGDPRGAFLGQARLAQSQAERVLQAQKMLARLELYEGPLHGGLDEATRTAIDKFLYQHGAVQTGSVDDDLLRRLTAAIQAWSHVSPDQLIAEHTGPPTTEEYRRIAERLGIDGPTLMAVKEVEMSASGFLRDGHPVIRFERHYFHNLTGGRYDMSHPGISDSRPGGYGLPGAAQWALLKEAYEVDPDAAYRSTSFGTAELMGDYYKQAGFETVAEFVRFVSRTEANQLEAWARWLQPSGALEPLRRHDWAAFARKHNGTGFARNQYVPRLKSAYERAVQQFASQ